MAPDPTDTGTGPGPDASVVPPPGPPTSGSAADAPTSVDRDADARVARDMERVFARFGGGSRRNPAAGAGSRPAQAPSPRRIGRGTLVGAMTAAMIVGFLVAALLRPASPPPASPTTSTPRAPATLPRAATPAPSPPRPGPEAEMAPARPAGAAQRAERRAEPSGKLAAARATPATATKRESSDRTPPVRPPVRPVDHPSDALPCQGTADQRRCLYEEVLRADRRLRRTYAAAATAGLSVADMRRARGSWKRALARSQREPLVSIGTLNGLDASLRSGVRSVAERPR